MRLISIDYSEFDNDSRRWSLSGLSLEACNLLVGKNATGKSRAVNLINGMAQNLLGRAVGLGGRWTATFLHEGKTFVHHVDIADQEVTSETLTIDGVEMLSRESGGGGTIRAVELGKVMKFQSPPSTLAIYSKRDSVQHPFLEPFFTWATGVRLYRFGGSLGRENLIQISPAGREIDETDVDQVVALFYKARKTHGSAFVQAIVNDLREIGYPVEGVDIGVPESVILPASPLPFNGFLVKETDREGVTDHVAMSQGMFRAVAILVHMNWLALSKTAGTVLIDDIGEGLDFERSCKLIGLLRKKVLGINVQLIMSTNDRFVMNEVPLSEWSVLVRTGSKVQVKNARNSRDAFEEFRFTGLNNFAFFELNVLGGDSGRVH